MYVCVCMCVLLCRRTSINRWGTSNTNRTKENNVRHVVYLAIGKHNFYVLLTRMSRFEFRDYQQCWSFFFFFCIRLSHAVRFSRYERITNTFDSETLASLYFSVDTENGNYRYPLHDFHFHRKKNRIIFRRDIVDKFHFFFFGMIIRQ